MPDDTKTESGPPVRVQPVVGRQCAHAKCTREPKWVSPMGNLLCDYHGHVMDRLYRLTDATCAPVSPNDPAHRPAR